MGRMRTSRPTLHRLIARGGRATISNWMPAPAVHISRMEGFFFKELTAPYLASIESALVQGTKLQIFADWAGMTGYDGEARQLMTAWIEKRSRDVIVRLCVKSGIVSMGVGMANAVIGGKITVTASNQTFYDSLRELVPKATHLEITRFSEGKDDGFAVQSTEVR